MLLCLRNGKSIPQLEYPRQRNTACSDPKTFDLPTFVFFLVSCGFIKLLKRSLFARGKSSIAILLTTAFLKMFSEKLFHANDNVLSFVSSFHARIRMFFVYERVTRKRYKDRLQKSFIVVKCETLYTPSVR